MFIKNQEGDTLINVDAIREITVNKTMGVCGELWRISTEKCQTLGMYTSEKRAFEVLDQIQHAANPPARPMCRECFVMPPDRE